eukprot:4304797-Lingulodinium_polyedra.AAC.1
MRWRNLISVRTGRARGATSLAFGQKSANKSPRAKSATKVSQQSSAKRSSTNKSSANKVRET